MSAMKTYYKHFTELSRHIARAALGCISQSIDIPNVFNIESSKSFIDLENLKMLFLRYIF